MSGAKGGHGAGNGQGADRGQAGSGELAGNGQGAQHQLPVPPDHRQSSHHIHHPLSTHLPPDARRKKGISKKSKKKARRASVPGETPTIEEAEEDEDEACDTETERSAEELRQPGPAEAVQVRAGLGCGQRWGAGSAVPPRLSVSGHSRGAGGAGAGAAPGRGDFCLAAPPMAHPLPPQFFLQEDEVTERRAEEPAALTALPGSPPEPRGTVTPKEAQASR